MEFVRVPDAATEPAGDSEIEEDDDDVLELMRKQARRLHQKHVVAVAQQRRRVAAALEAFEGRHRDHHNQCA